MDLGASLQKDGSAWFRVWAPNHSTLNLKLENKIVPMNREERGYFTAMLDNVRGGRFYTYILSDGQERADPVSRSLPHGIEGPTEIIDPEAFEWTDLHWRGIPQEELIFYECHVGTFTEQGTFRGIIERLSYLKELGINCIELMPIGAFPGRCNWGYDGVSPYAPHHIYGGPTDLKELVNACHLHGISVALDVVYNHFGPEGAYLTTFGPYLTEKYQTPWGKAINYDGSGSDEVKHFMLQNALYWIEEYHIDVLRLDALHALFDQSPYPFLQQLVENVGDKAYLIGENDLNDSRLIRHPSLGGVGFHGWWNEDFHHALHVTFTGEQKGYYGDYKGISDLKETMQRGVVYQNKFSRFRNRSHGNSFRGIDTKQLVVFSQNHDQIGNRPRGDRLSTQLSFERQKVLAMILLLSPYLPLLFMGQEYGETTPFEYFVDYANLTLMQAVYEGRKKEFQVEELLYPDISAFHRSKLKWDLNTSLLNLYKRVIQLRHSALQGKIKVISSTKDILMWEYDRMVICCSLSDNCNQVKLPFKGHLQQLLHTEQKEFGGSKSFSFDEERKSIIFSGPCGTIFVHP
jgi:maltooligosyltrehalose trehalohydrolase